MVPSPLPLAERLRPKRLDDIAGNPRARAELRAWARSWTSGPPPARRAVLLSGPPGVGKTTAALALASEMGWTLVEMNASDARNQAALEGVAGRASITHTLSDRPKGGAPAHALILLDEADCLSGRAAEPARTPSEPLSLREFLRARYREVAALNAAWKLGGEGQRRGFAGWESVPRSPGTAAWARSAEARRDLDEWRSSSRPVDTSDRGGLATIARLVRTTLQPIVLTVNDERALLRNAPVIRTAVLRLRFYPLRDEELAARLERVARSEKIALGRGVLEAIVARVRGDLRAGLNDLDAVAPLPPGPAQVSVLGFRDLASDFAQLTEEALSEPRFFRAVEVRDRLDAPPDDLLPWIEENLPWFAPDAIHQDAAFAVLAVADRFLYRARRTRTYGLWSYASELLTGGIGLALHERPSAHAGRAAQFPRFLGEMGRTRVTRALREGVVEKAGRRFHLSKSLAREYMLPFLESGVRAPAGGERSARAFARALALELDLTHEEATYLLGYELEEPRSDEDRTAPSAGAPKEERRRSPPPEEPEPPAEAREADRRRSVQRKLGEYAR